MAIFLIKNKDRAVIGFRDPDLDKYSILAYVVRYRAKTFVNFALPTITFRHHDTRIALDIADGLEKAVNYAAKQMNIGNPRFIAKTREPVWSADGQRVVLPIFERKSSPYIEVRVDPSDGFVRWTVLGFSFNDDLPSAVRYAVALKRMPDYARQIVQPQ